MNEKIILSEIEKVKDSLGRIKYSKLDEIIVSEISQFYINSDILTKKELISSFYRGYREVNNCIKKGCKSFQRWDNNKLIFRPYCSINCSNTDPEKDRTIVNNNMVKYGVPRASMTEASKKKLEDTNMEKYGYKASSQSPEVKAKAKATNIGRYGHSSSSVSEIRNLDNYNNKDFITERFIKDGSFLKDEFMEYFNCGQVAAHNTLNRLEINYSKFKSKGNTGIERLFEQFLIETNILYISKYRDGLELDFYLPDLNIGIELDGLYYHSYGKFSFGKSKNYFKNKHKNKLEYFKERGISVLFIWENEIKDKFNIWKSMFRYKVLKDSKRVFARKTEIRLLGTEERINFLKENHIQGNTIAKYAYGLFSEDVLVSCMTFAASDKNKHYEYELKRFSVKQGWSVVGGASKLLKHFEHVHKPKNIITYLNNRWSISDNFYKNLGFEFVSDSEPNFYIVSGLKIFNRLQFQKHKLKDIDGFNFIEENTAHQNIIDNGYRIIWDAGNKVYKKNYSEGN